MQFQVPQFIETEDKIIGPLTLKQFLYLAAGGAIIFALSFMLQTFIWIIISIVIGGIAAAFAFVKINGQPFQKIIFFIFYYYWNPQNYLWQPENKSVVKTEENVGALARREGFSLDNLVSGFTLKNTWQKVTTTKEVAAPQKPPQEKYEIMRKSTGEREAMKRVDYT